MSLFEFESIYIFLILTVPHIKYLPKISILNLMPHTERHALRSRIVKLMTTCQLDEKQEKILSDIKDQIKI